MEEAPTGQNEGSDVRVTGDQFRLLVDSVKDYAIFLLDPSGNILSWNQGAERLKGYRASEIIGSHFSRFYTAEDIAAEKPAWEIETATAEGRVEEEGWRMRKDGSLFWADVVLTALHDDAGRLVGFAKVTRDLTERRQAEKNARQLAREEARRQAAEESEKRLALVQLDLATALAEREDALARLKAERLRLGTILRQMPVGVLIAEAADLRFTLANEQAERLFEASLVGQRIATHGFYDAFHPDGRPFTLDEYPLVRAMRGEVIGGQEIRIVTASGTRLVISLHAAPLRDASGAISGAVAAFQDITLAKEAEAAAQQQAVFREQFIGILGHDLRNPLAAVKAGAQLLLRKGLPEAQTRSVSRIASSAERMERMIADLLDLTRTRLGGGIPVSPRPADLRATCRQVIEEHQIAHPRVAFTLDAHGNTWGEWDTDRIAQALSNLIGNAVAYGRPGGPVTVTIHDRGDELVFDVHNEGPAIPEEIRPLLFDPYRRAVDRHRRSTGLGLGLFITRAIAEAHGGGVSFETSDEAGTTFSVRLPREAPSG